MTLTTVIASGNRAPSRRRRLGSVAIEASPAQFQPLIQQIVRAIHEAGGRKAASASGVPCSAPTILTQAATPVVSSGVSSRDRANAASAPDLLAETNITGWLSLRAARTAAAMAAALSSTESLSPDVSAGWVSRVDRGAGAGARSRTPSPGDFGKATTARRAPYTGRREAVVGRPRNAPALPGGSVRRPLAPRGSRRRRRLPARRQALQSPPIPPARALEAVPDRGVDSRQDPVPRRRR